MQDAALAYLRRGYKVFPVNVGLKKPNGALVEHGVLEATDNEATVRAWFTQVPASNIGLACEGLFVIDCDPGHNWPGVERLKAEAACPVQSTPRGGLHFVFRRPAGKPWGNSQSRVAYKIDTRADGGYIVAAPSHTIDCPEEKTVEGDYRFETPLVPRDELPEPPDWLVAELDAAFAPKPVPAVLPSAVPPVHENDVVQRAIAYLAACPPAVSGQGGHNQTFAVTQALVHGFCLEPQTVLRLLRDHYNPRCKPAWSEKELQHKVDSALKHPSDKPSGWLRDTGFEQPADGTDVSQIVAMSCGHSDISAPIDEDASDKAEIADPGPIPDNLMQVPGFVDEVMDFCLESARYPSVPLAFCGAMTLQSFLCSRRVREEGGLRPNLYMLALAGSGTGKAYPRKINSYILSKIGLGGAVGNQIASGQGLEDEMFIHRKMLFQTDEVDNMLRALSSSKETYHSMLLAMLLQLYTEADETHSMRAKAKGKGQGNEVRGEIDQPGLVIFGTATPECFFEAMSPRLLTNGLFSRSIVVDVGQRGRKQRTRDVSDMPSHLVEVAQWWQNYNPSPPHPLTGLKPTFNDIHPVPAIVPYTDEGLAVLDELGTEADDQYDAATLKGDRVRATLWTRVCENATRLALVYACSRDREQPRIDREAAQWASRFVRHLAARMLFLASSHVAENPFHAECLKVKRALQRSPTQCLQRQHLLRVLRCKSTDFDQIVFTLMQQGEIEFVEMRTKTKPAQGFRLV